MCIRDSSGIMSVDEGQFEAGRSLGLNYTQTMRLIILAQAFKNVLPALANEFITLLKETSISGYIAIPEDVYKRQVRSMASVVALDYFCHMRQICMDL